MNENLESVSRKRFGRNQQDQNQRQGWEGRLLFKLAGIGNRMHEPWITVSFVAVGIIPVISAFLKINHSALFFIYLISIFCLLVMFIACFVNTVINLRERMILRLAGGQAIINSLNWSDFEALTSAYFKAEGYDVELRGGLDGDGGIDMIIRKNGKQYVVQCKHWQLEKVPVSLVRELYGVMSMENFDGAFFVTSGSYTPVAMEQFEPFKEKMTLINGSELFHRINALPDDKRIPKEQDKNLERFLGKLKEISMREADIKQGILKIPKCRKCHKPQRLIVKGNDQFWGCRDWRTTCKGVKTKKLSHEETSLIGLYIASPPINPFTTSRPEPENSSLRS